MIDLVSICLVLLVLMSQVTMERSSFESVSTFQRNLIMHIVHEHCGLFPNEIMCFMGKKADLKNHTYRHYNSKFMAIQGCCLRASHSYSHAFKKLVY